MAQDADAADGTHPPPTDDPLGALAPWVGTWQGDGHGDFPTIDAFDFIEEVTFAATGKPMLAYTQRTRSADGRPLHAESGFLRGVGPPDPTTGAVAVEWIIAQPTGLAETADGTLVDGVVTTTSRVHRTPTAVEVRTVRRRYAIDGGDLVYDLWMATADVPEPTHHLRAALRRT